jgi:uncharacterized membrane protein YhaH (DUF805 family)
MTLSTITLSIFAFPTAFWLVMYLLPQIFMVVRPVPDLKKRYSATWALVTGSGSGIGESTCTYLVILIALSNEYFTLSNNREVTRVQTSQSRS